MRLRFEWSNSRLKFLSNMKPSQIPAWLGLSTLLFMATVPMLAALLRLEVSTTTQDLIGQDTAEVQFEKFVRNNFSHAANLIVLFSGKDLFEDTFLDKLDKLTQALERNPIPMQILTVSNFERTRGYNGAFIIDNLLDASARSSLDAEERRNRVLADPFATGRLISADGTTTVLVITPERHVNSRERAIIRDMLISSIHAYGLDNHLEGMTGSIAINLAQMESVWSDIRMLAPLSLMLGLGLVVWMFRRLLAIAAVLLVTSASLGTMLAFIAAAGESFTLLNVIQIPLLMALSVALLVHWFNALSQQEAKGYRGVDLINRAHAYIHRPALFTALTTAAGFFSLSVSPHPISLFGKSVALAVLVQYICVLWLIPSLHAYWDKRDWKRRNMGVDNVGRPIVRMAIFSMKHPSKILILLTILILTILPFIQNLHFNADLLSFFSPHHPVVQTTERFSKAFHGITTIEVILTGNVRDHFKQVANLNKVRHLRDWAVKQPAVDQVHSLVNILEDMHWAFHDENDDFRYLPEDEQLLAQYLLFYDGDELHAHVDREFEMTRISLFTSLRGSREIQHFIDAFNQQIAETNWANTSVNLTGDTYLLATNEQYIMTGQIRGMALASIMIFALLCLLWRSPTGALICMVPNLLPVLLILILMGMWNIPLNTFTAMITSIVLGISVDDTIHIYQGYHDQRRIGNGHAWSLVHSYRRAGRAVTASTIILTGGVMILAKSDFMVIKEFSLMVASGLLFAWFFDTVFMPALLSVTTASGILKIPVQKQSRPCLANTHLDRQHENPQS